MPDRLDLPVTFHGATAEFIELVKQQAADPQKLTTEQLQKIAQTILPALEKPAIVPEKKQ